MSLIKTGGGITDVRGSFGGVYFTRDGSGLHCSAKPRRVHQITDAQRKQRNAFIKARTYTKDPRWVSYYMYRAMNDLPFIFDAKVTGAPNPDCTGKYELTGTFNGKDYYNRIAGTWFIWWDGTSIWTISDEPGNPGVAHWLRHDPNMLGAYQPLLDATGIATVGLHLQPPPADYQIPRL